MLVGVDNGSVRFILLEEDLGDPVVTSDLVHEGDVDELASASRFPVFIIVGDHCVDHLALFNLLQTMVKLLLRFLVLSFLLF